MIGELCATRTVPAVEDVVHFLRDKEHHRSLLTSVIAKSLLVMMGVMALALVVCFFRIPAIGYKVAKTCEACNSEHRYREKYERTDAD
jgi:hypothetical protein